MNELELKPCPLCGGPGLYRSALRRWVKCTAPNCEMQDVTVKRWQSRPIEDALTARIAELESEVRRLEADNARLRAVIERAACTLARGRMAGVDPGEWAWMAEQDLVRAVNCQRQEALGLEVQP